MHLPTTNLFSLLSLLTPATPQAEYMFAYYQQNSGCTEHVPNGHAISQSIATDEFGMCVGVNNDLGGTFDVSISGKTYWTNTRSPILKACPTIDCDLYPDNGCLMMWNQGEWPGTSVCKRMTETYFWAIGPQGFNLKERSMRHGERRNGTYANGTMPGSTGPRSSAE